MRKLFLIAAMSTFTQLSFAEVSCNCLAQHFRAEMQNAITTQANVTRYLNSNASDWSGADTAFRRLSANGSRFSYNGNAASNASTSRSNAGHMSRATGQLRNFTEAMAQKIQECLSAPQSNELVTEEECRNN